MMGLWNYAAPRPHLPQVLEQFYKEALYAGLVTNLNLLTDNHGASAILELDYGEPEDRGLYESVIWCQYSL